MMPNKSRIAQRQNCRCHAYGLHWTQKSLRIAIWLSRRSNALSSICVERMTCPMTLPWVRCNVSGILLFLHISKICSNQRANVEILCCFPHVNTLQQLIYTVSGKGWYCACQEPATIKQHMSQDKTINITPLHAHCFLHYFACILKHVGRNNRRPVIRQKAGS